ncbi:uncharacterized protein MYCFIDRAFT_83606 [Pseudocercospora fijiensis CIRAD86]|uniref:SET domain-containing protein n=1 Tax=Pseudocercospora fijiensis (strain CIRAD86) TaxID=383855 RepID=M3AXD8_PSEFD|nr:uncharacterized protein MYCFIDRAFT_83606 [Pseudocercospora fijiensis CIRAD86]EME82142.1 hypothetical protein MYCFIDRAFT_83606 [Pseudocercospora fijiensis CIRAD86]
MNTLTETRKTDGKGYGVFALQPLKRGTIIYTEEPILSFDKPSHLVSPADLELAVKKLGAADRKAVLALHRGTSVRFASKLKAIYHANSFGDQESSSLYLKISRINHSCIPNAVVTEWHAVIALKDIAEGEELEISYLNDRISGWTARQRKALLEMHYGFECRCIACRPTEFMRLSECRRKLITHLRYALDGSPPDYSRFENIVLTRTPDPPAPRWRPLTEVQRIEYTFLLACLYEAEGQCPAQQVAELLARRNYVLTLVKDENHSRCGLRRVQYQFS